MFQDPSGRLATTIEQAELFIFKFVAENHACPEKRVHDRSHGYDLYLPWLLEVVENVHIDDRSAAPQVCDLDELYMDAAWSLVTKGYLRPGPKRITGDNPREGYGKGYSLTPKGRAEVRCVCVDVDSWERV
jgi:hypothetical protein